MKMYSNQNPALNIAPLLACIAALAAVPSARAATLLGPVNGDIEVITGGFKPVSWFYGELNGGFVNAIPGNGVAGSTGIGMGVGAANQQADLRSSPIIVAGPPIVDFTFDYRFLPPAGAPPLSGSMRVDLRFWSNAAATTFLGERNVFLTPDANNTSIDFTTYSLNGVALPAGTVSADIRVTANIFTGFQGWSNMDNFSVTSVPEPSSLALLSLATMTLIRRRRWSPKDRRSNSNPLPPVSAAGFAS